jgi:DNA gyrase subunit A
MVRAELVADAPGGGIVAPTRRSKHDAVRSWVDATVRADVGAVTSAGRLIRFSPVDLPSVPANSVALAAGTRADTYLGLTGGEHVVAIVPLVADPVIALGTAQGVVKRVAATELPAGKHDVEIIALKPGDRVIGAVPAPDGAELVFVASDAQLLRFDAASVRPQGRSAGGMAGIRLGGSARVVAFDAVPSGSDEVVVVTVAGSSQAIPGTDAGSAKVSPFAEFPAKGRATGGVRAQRFLRGEDELTVAWVGAGPRAVAADGSVRTLPAPGAKRDASGQLLDAVISAVGSAVA